MISVETLSHALTKERVRIRRFELKTDFMLGVMQGLKLAVAMAREIYLNTKHQRVPAPFGRKR